MQSQSGTVDKRKPEVFKSGAIHDVVVRAITKHVDTRGWLAELFRHDELAAGFHPAMAYISLTNPQVMRGPHEHLQQCDLFCFLGPSNFKIRLWDNRPGSKTYRYMMMRFAGEDDPQLIIVPAGIVHAYRNIGHVAGISINCPNRLFKGAGRNEPVDEIRHENDPHTIFQMDD